MHWSFIWFKFQFSPKYPVHFSRRSVLSLSGVTILTCEQRENVGQPELSFLVPALSWPQPSHHSVGDDDYQYHLSPFQWDLKNDACLVNIFKVRQQKVRDVFFGNTQSASTAKVRENILWRRGACFCPHRSIPQPNWKKLCEFSV